MHQDLADAFAASESSMNRSGHGGESYMPRSPAQMASVKKAAKASAVARGERAQMLNRSPRAPNTPVPAAVAPGPLKAPPGISTGGLALVKKPKKGLLSL
jgi:hypothetical protein